MQECPRACGKVAKKVLLFIRCRSSLKAIVSSLNWLTDQCALKLSWHVFQHWHLLLWQVIYVSLCFDIKQQIGCCAAILEFDPFLRCAQTQLTPDPTPHCITLQCLYCLQMYGVKKCVLVGHVRQQAMFIWDCYATQSHFCSSSWVAEFNTTVAAATSMYIR